MKLKKVEAKKGKMDVEKKPEVKKEVVKKEVKKEVVKKDETKKEGDKKAKVVFKRRKTPNSHLKRKWVLRNKTRVLETALS